MTTNTAAVKKVLARPGLPAGSWLTPKQVSGLLTATFDSRIAPRTVLSWCVREARPLPSITIAGRRFISKAELLGWLGGGTEK